MRREQPPVYPQVIHNAFKEMNGLQRAVESFRYSILAFEHWISPQGHFREWLRRNALLGTFLLIPAVLVMPIVGIILWQVDGWMTLLTSIVTTLITHPIQTLFLLIILKVVIASRRR